MAKKHTYKSRQRRETDIILAAWGQRTRGIKTFTNAKMAKWLGLSASTKLKRMIEGLAAQGWFDVSVQTHRNTFYKDGNVLIITKHVYSLTDEALEWLAII